MGSVEEHTGKDAWLSFGEKRAASAVQTFAPRDAFASLSRLASVALAFFGQLPQGLIILTLNVRIGEANDMLLIG